jgi:hypothetical protein
MVLVNHLNDVIVRIQKGPRTKAKVVHVNNIKQYNGDIRFDWFIPPGRSDNEKQGNDVIVTDNFESEQLNPTPEQETDIPLLYVVVNERDMNRRD